MKAASSLVFVAILLSSATGLLADDKKRPTPVYTDPLKTDEDFDRQGEYVGQIGDKTFGVQIIALGDGQFEAVTCMGGLPGDGWDGERPRERTKAKRTDDGTVQFTSETGYGGLLKPGGIEVIDADGVVLGELPKVDRQSPTLGKKPPKGAIVLFDSSGKGAFSSGKTTNDGLLEQGAICDQRFGDHTLHVEFRTPYKPHARGQGRGNSGLYLQGRYEVQILDSFGLEGKDNECGGVYKISPPKENLCYPPLTWQTYDIDFTAAKFDESGKKTSNARMTVRHNGVIIHQDLDLPKTTAAARTSKESSEKTPFYLQDHGNPVRFRNIWALEKN